MDPDTHPSAFIAEKIVCNGCAAKERQASLDHKGGKRPGHGVKYRVRNRKLEG